MRLIYWYKHNLLGIYDLGWLMSCKTTETGLISSCFYFVFFRFKCTEPPPNVCSPIHSKSIKCENINGTLHKKKSFTFHKFTNLVKLIDFADLFFSQKIFSRTNLTQWFIGILFDLIYCYCFCWGWPYKLYYLTLISFYTFENNHTTLHMNKQWNIFVKQQQQQQRFNVSSAPNRFVRSRDVFGVVVVALYHHCDYVICVQFQLVQKMIVTKKS